MVDYVSQMSGKCGTCQNCTFKSTGSWYCEKYHEYKKIDEPYKKCYGYKKAGYRNNGDISKAIAAYNKSCFITTLVCNILGYEDDCDFLREFRKFRNETLSTNKYGQILLLEYDTFGPIVASKMFERYCNEKTKKQMISEAKKLQTYYLEPLYLMLTSDPCKYEKEIIKKYVNMVHNLMNEYGIYYDPQNIDFSKANSENVNLGHAKCPVQLEVKPINCSERTLRLQKFPLK